MPTLPPKKEVLLALLEKASVRLVLDARRDGVIVPRHLKTSPQLVLQIGLNLPVPIRDLDVGDDDVRCTLSFSRTGFFCVLPYTAIFAMVSDDDGRGMVWPDDVPAEVAEAEEKRRLQAVEERDAAPPQGSSPRLEIAPPPPKRRREEPKAAAAAKPAPKPKAAATRAKATKEPAATKRELPPYLRVIK